VVLISGKITVKPTRRNARGQIVDKGAYCCFCLKFVCRLFRHFSDCHSTESEVVRLKMVTSSEEKKVAVQLLKNRGNWLHNCSVLKANEGEMVVSRAPADVSTFNHRDYIPCDLCFAVFKEAEMYRHNCPKASTGLKPRAKSGKVLAAQAMDSRFSKGMANVLVGIHDDEIGRVAKSDELLLAWLEFYVKTGFWSQSKWRSQTRSKMRLGARLLIELRKTYPDAGLRDVLAKENFIDIVEATKACALNTGDKESLQVPLKMGHLINSLLQRMLSQAMIDSDKETRKAVVEFQKLMKSDWGTSVTTACHFAIREKNRNEAPCIPTKEDVVKFADHCKAKLDIALQEFEESKTTTNYRYLQKATLARISQFNRRRGGDVASLTLVDFQKAMGQNISANDEIFMSLTKEEQEAAVSHKLIVVNGKRNKNNFCILDYAMVKGLELIIRYRETSQIDPENKFVFAIPNSQESTLNASKIRAEFAAEAGVTKMVARGMRKYLATVLQVIPLSVPVSFRCFYMLVTVLTVFDVGAKSVPIFTVSFLK
jgi:hypothetical protein